MRVSCLGLWAVLSCAGTAQSHHALGKTGSAADIRIDEIGPVLWRLQTAADIIRLLRPGMVVERDAAGAYYVDATHTSRPHHLVVYVDDVPVGGLDVLASIPAKAVFRIRRLTPSEATTRYGTEVASDIIAITTYAASAR